MFKSSNRRSRCNGKPCEPTQYDILCGKDKTHAKHTGNRLFRGRIEAMKVSYCAAPTKQEKMTITKEIVTYMQSEYGSRFLKMNGANWVEINNQAARDKVSHALRFAARNLKKAEKLAGAKSSTSPDTITATKRSRKEPESDASVSSSGSDPSSSNDSDDEPIPLSQVFDHTFDMNFAQNFSPAQQDRQSAFLGFSRKSAGYLDFGATTATSAADADFLMAATSLSLRSMQLDDLDVAPAASKKEQQKKQIEPFPTTKQQQPEPEFNTLRSEDLNDILNEPLDGEWEVVRQLAEC